MGLFSRNKQADAPADHDITNDELGQIILTSIDDGVVFIDSNGIIRAFNQAASRITGWETNDALSLQYGSVFNLVDNKGNPYTEAQNPFIRALTNKQSVRDNQADLVTRNDKRLPLFLSISPLSDEQGQLQGAVAVFRDVSKERGEESQRAEFISTASHEMRTPVAAIEGYLALAMNDNVCKIDTKAREYLTKAHSSTQHLGKLFQDLLTAAKSEDGRLTNNPVLTDLASFVQEVADANRFVAEKKGLLVEMLIGGQSSNGAGFDKQIAPFYYTMIDPDRMREVITNLFDNAVKYTDQGKITFSVTGDDSIVQISVSDTGNGIPDEDLPHLFQKFYRVDNTATRAVGGTGLGLYICKKIVELYQGRIWAESKLGEGSTFRINLPRVSSARAQQIMPQTTQDTTPTQLP